LPFLIKAIITGVWWYLIVALINTSLMINDVACFSNICLQFACLFWDVSIGLFPLIEILAFFYWVVCVSYIFWVLTPCQMYGLQIFSPISCCFFSLCWLLPWLWRSFLVCYDAICLFFVCCLCLWILWKKFLASSNVLKHFPHIFF
jgi:hypothetical protein